LGVGGRRLCYNSVDRRVDGRMLHSISVHSIVVTNQIRIPNESPSTEGTFVVLAWGIYNFAHQINQKSTQTHLQNASECEWRTDFSKWKSWSSDHSLMAFLTRATSGGLSRNS
jgi:hypothetical protein